MGKTSQPLTIKVHSQWQDHEKIKELADKGHVITTDAALDDCDLILHPNAWRWNDGHWEYLEVALREARKGRPKARNDAAPGLKRGAGKRPKGSATK